MERLMRSSINSLIVGTILEIAQYLQFETTSNS